MKMSEQYLVLLSSGTYEGSSLAALHLFFNPGDQVDISLQDLAVSFKKNMKDFAEAFNKEIERENKQAEKWASKEQLDEYKARIRSPGEWFEKLLRMQSHEACYELEYLEQDGWGLSAWEGVPITKIVDLYDMDDFCDDDNDDYDEGHSFNCNNPIY